MKKERTDFYRGIVENVVKIMTDKGLNQRELADRLGCKESTVSKIVNYETALSFDRLSEIASALGVTAVDILTYPDKYVKAGSSSGTDPVEAILQIRLQKDKKDQVLRLIFGDNNIEILNK